MIIKKLIGMNTNRRTVLRWGSLLTAGLSAGCGEVNAPRNREIQLRRIQVKNQTDDTYEMRLQLTKSVTGGSDTWGTFNDVRIVGYSRSGNLVCEKSLGTVKQDGTERYVNVNCIGFPVVFTFDTQESPCDDNTRIMVSIYQGRREGEHYWLSERPRECDEGLPPEVDTTSRGLE
jgi:hypothetical protein